MKKENVFIIVTQMRSLKTKSKDSWQVVERVEFVDQIRNRHYSTATAIGDYVNQKMLLGMAKGIEDYSKFETYIREKYPKQMEHLDTYFRPKPEETAVTAEGENIVVAE
jgi:hypothetical protein